MITLNILWLLTGDILNFSFTYAPLMYLISFMQLSWKPYIASILVAVGLYFLLKPHFGTETVSWMCILGAAPFAALGFITYHGMTAEQFLWAWLRSELLEPKELRFEASNLYYEALKDKLEGGKS